LRQVSDPAARHGQQVAGVGGLDVLGHDEHGGRPRRPAQSERGAQAVVGHRGWHADVHHGQVRPLSGHGTG
jgi:hypothetical protein